MKDKLSVKEYENPFKGNVTSQWLSGLNVLNSAPLDTSLVLRAYIP